jgi:hypothetical protein
VAVEVAVVVVCVPVALHGGEDDGSSSFSSSFKDEVETAAGCDFHRREIAVPLPKQLSLELAAIMLCAVRFRIVAYRIMVVGGY